MGLKTALGDDVDAALLCHVRPGMMILELGLDLGPDVAAVPVAVADVAVAAAAD